jgi:hypothetical protein
LRVEGLKLGEIAKELSSAYGANEYTRPSIKDWFQQIKLGTIDLRTQYAVEPPHFDNIDAEILALLRKYRFSSVRTIVGSLVIPASTIYSHLVEEIDL